ncbi:ankyrin repeat protein, partial [Phyllosticta capitalensis]
GMTALRLAVEYGQGPVFELLLSRHANVNAADSKGYTSLHWAAERGNLEICEALVNHHADLNLMTKPTLKVDAGMTPLHLATKYDNGDVVKFLLSHHDAKVDARDCEEFSSLHWAAKKGYLEICKSLVDHQADL